MIVSSITGVPSLAICAPKLRYDSRLLISCFFSLVHSLLLGLHRCIELALDLVF